MLIYRIIPKSRVDHCTVGLEHVIKWTSRGEDEWGGGESQKAFPCSSRKWWLIAKRIQLGEHHETLCGDFGVCGFEVTEIEHRATNGFWWWWSIRKTIRRCWCPQWGKASGYLKKRVYWDICKQDHQRNEEIKCGVWVRKGSKSWSSSYSRAQLGVLTGQRLRTEPQRLQRAQQLNACYVPGALLFVFRTLS